MATSTPSLELSPNDLSILLNKVASMSPSNVVNFGIQLNITRNVIEGFEIHHNRDMKQCLREILNERLKREPPLTWPDIVTALRADSVGESRLARKIEARYMPSSQAPSSGPPQLERAEASLSQVTSPQPSVHAAIEAIKRHASRLTETFGNDLQAFSSRFVECGFISSSAANEISSKHGIGNQQKGSELLNLVIANCRITCDAKKWFDTFITVLSSERAYEGLSSSIRKEFTALHSSSVRNRAESVQGQGTCTGSPSDQYPLSVNAATYSGSQVQDTAEPPATKRPRLQPPVNEATHSGSQVQGRVSPPTPDPFTMFIKYVKAVYRKSAVRRDTSVVKWPPTPSRVYINLALIDRKRVSGKSKEYEEVTEAMILDGNVDIIYETKMPIEFSEVGGNIYFPSNCDPLNTSPYDQKEKGRRLILVEGAPGVGKSTFAWEYCRRWERGKIAQQYDLVLLLRLRDVSISRAKTLRDLIYYPMEGVPKDVCKGLVASHGLHVMIILEGFDELPDSGRSEESVFMELISGKLLPLATVLVTSRPWATELIRIHHEDRISQHIEILGFTNTQISEYIKSTIPQEKVSELTTYLERHPQIRAGMYIPLNSAIVVTVYQESQDSGCPMPTTLTELYTALVRTLLVRYLRVHPKYGSSINKFTDLPSEVYVNFLNLCEVAYNGIVSTSNQVQLIFSERDLPADFDNLGLMDSVTELYVTQGTVSSHNFLHLTFQEFFAAVHISNMSSAQQLEHFQKERKQDMYQEQSGGYGNGSGGGRLKVVLKFLAGLMDVDCFSKEIINHFIQTPPRSAHRRNCDAVVDADLVSWMFEAQSDDALTLLLEQKLEISVGSYNMMDFYSLGYCIAHSKCRWVLRVSGAADVEEERVKMLTSGASTSDGGQGGKIVGLVGNFNEVFKLSVEHLNSIITQWKSFLQLHQLSLIASVPCDEITWPDLSQLRVLELTFRNSVVKLDSLLSRLSLESLTIIGPLDTKLDCTAIESHLIKTSTLKHISISQCFCSVSGLLLLANAIHGHATLREKTLEELYVSRLEGNDEARHLAQLYTQYHNMMVNSVKWIGGPKVTGISDAGAEALAQVLHHSFTLKKLNLSNNSISGAGALALAKALRHNSTLKKLNLSNNSISGAGALALAKALRHNSTLTILNVSENNISDAGVVALASALHYNSTLRRLNVSENGISGAGVMALASALQHNSTLKRLNVSENSISGAGALALAKALHHNSTLTRLNVSENSISDAGIVALASALHYNSTLRRLNVSENGISGAGVMALASALQHNSTLRRLNFSGNSISDGVVALASALQHNCTLRRLNVSENSISDVGAVALTSALHYNSTLRKLDLTGNAGISEMGTRQLLQSLNTRCKLSIILPWRCKEYATQCLWYCVVNKMIHFE